MAKSQEVELNGDTLTAADYETLASFRYGVRRYLVFAENAARSAGLTSQQHQTLLAIKAYCVGGRTMSVGDVAAQLLLKHHSAVELISRLQKAGYTRRIADPTDGRKMLVSLTTKGEGVLAALSANNLRELKMIAPALRVS